MSDEWVAPVISLFGSGRSEAGATRAAQEDPVARDEPRLAAVLAEPGPATGAERAEGLACGLPRRRSGARRTSAWRH
ncbi:hypothetical protein [Naasia aerilata]|uniref:Uncharacterized protein n=1 Tax=Naasia aerilata TaxID=1162966 RepID=A0ABM8GGU4_9MICO|nr:hypothetical protein [Naasia aerilata]BDZ47586.1 hypothetical protein GCM10025866_34950 [Naasia aerilata]